MALEALRRTVLGEEEDVSGGSRKITSTGSEVMAEVLASASASRESAPHLDGSRDLGSGGGKTRFAKSSISAYN